MGKLDKPVLYEELTLKEVTELSKKRGIIILPAGTTEGHGYHIPMGTDTFVAEWIATQLSMLTGLPTLTPTPIRCGCSPTIHFDTNGDPCSGTLAIGHNNMQNLVKEICRGFWSAGFRKVIIIQAHGQKWNFQSIAHEVATELRREKKPLFIAAATYWELCGATIKKLISAPFWHAGEWETSAMMHVKPDLVRYDSIKGNTAEPLIDKSLMKGSVIEDNTEAFSVQDVAAWWPIPVPGEIHDWGKGAEEEIKSASKEKGEEALNRAVDRYLALIRDLEMYYGPDEVPGVDVRKRPSKPKYEVDY